MLAFSLILQLILGLMFTFLGISSLIGTKKALENFSHLHLPTWFRIVTGIVQLIGAAGMVIGIWNSPVAVFSGIWIGITMLVGALLHIRVNKTFSQSIPALVVLAIAMIVVFINV